jgi:type VI secretion system protein ImpH
MEGVGADDGAPEDAVISRLMQTPYAFNLFQAICLLERATKDARDVGVGNGSDEAIRLSSVVSLGFEPSDVRSVRTWSTRRVPEVAARQHAGSHGYVLSTPAFTLAGACGPLPLAYTELALERRSARDDAMADFLDIVNHRFLSFLYRNRKKLAPGLNWRSPHASVLARCLDMIGNLGLHDGRLGPRRASLWIRHAGLFGSTPRSMAGLLTILSDRLGLTVTGKQFVGSWRPIEASDRACLGLSSVKRATRLDGTKSLGNRVWDQAGAILIHIHDLSPARFSALLPDGDEHALVAWLVHCYLQMELDVFLLLGLVDRSREGAPESTPAPRLGWTSWLACAPGEKREPVAVRLRQHAAQCCAQ